METLFETFFSNAINEEIERHPAWMGRISGLTVDKMLRKQNPYLYILRAGECEGDNTTDYYVSFTLPDGTVKHQPFVIILTAEGWRYENCTPGGPYVDASIDDVLHLIMHCEKNQCTPWVDQKRKWA